MADLQLVLGQISDVNNIYFWQLDKHNLHVKVDDVLLSSTAEIAKYMKGKLHQHIGSSHITLQCETEGCITKDNNN